MLDYNTMIDWVGKYLPNPQAIRLNQRIDQLRKENLDLRDEMTELKNQLKIKDELLNKINSYKLIKTIGGAMVYESMGEPKHYVCPKCMSNNEIHILQDQGSSDGKVECPNCNNKFKVKEASKRTNFRNRNRNKII